MRTNGRRECGKCSVLECDPLYNPVYFLISDFVTLSSNDDLFRRLETVHFFRLFTGEGDMENTGRGNTEPRGLKSRVLP
jgi:hypothetical protein